MAHRPDIVRSRSIRAASAELDFYAVCLIGYEHAVPEGFHSNRARWPVRVAMTRDPTEITKKTDIEQPLHKVVVLAYVWTTSDAHAKRLKMRLDGYLLGWDEDAPLRHGWRDLDDPIKAWPVLLNLAVTDIRLREDIEVFDEAERQSRINRHRRRQWQ